MRRSRKHECGVATLESHPRVMIGCGATGGLRPEARNVAVPGRPFPGNAHQAEVVGQTLVVLRSFVVPAPRMSAKNCCCSFIMSPAMSNHAVRTCDRSAV